MRKAERRSWTRMGLVALFAVFAGVAACDDDDPITPDVGLEEADLVGAYEATTLTVTEGTETTNVIGQGGSMDLTLSADGTLSGTLDAPGMGADGGDLNETLSGTWDFDDVGDNIDFTITGSEIFVDDFDSGVEETESGTILIEGDAEYTDSSVAFILQQSVP